MPSGSSVPELLGQIEVADGVEQSRCGPRLPPARNNRGRGRSGRAAGTRLRTRGCQIPTRPGNARCRSRSPRDALPAPPARRLRCRGESRPPGPGARSRRPSNSSRTSSTVCTYSPSCSRFMRQGASYQAGIGMWSVKQSPARPRSSAAWAYSRGCPVAWPHSGVCRCESERCGGRRGHAYSLAAARAGCGSRARHGCVTPGRAHWVPERTVSANSRRQGEETMPNAMTRANHQRRADQGDGRAAVGADRRPDAVQFKTRKALALVLYLALEGPQPQDTLLELLWPDAPNGGSLRTAALHVRQALGQEAGRLQTHWCGLSLDLSGAQLDVWALGRLDAQAKRWPGRTARFWRACTCAATPPGTTT